MAYDGKVMSAALQRFEEDKQRRASQAAARRLRIYREIPRLEEIERELRGTMSRILSEALQHGEDPAPALARIRAENALLQQERAQLLTAHGYAADALEDKPRCVLCGDTGYCGGKMCACLQKFYAQEQIKNLSSLLDVGSQSFDTFDLGWYDGTWRCVRPLPLTSAKVRRIFCFSVIRVWGRPFSPRASPGWSARTAFPWCMTPPAMCSPGARQRNSTPTRSWTQLWTCGGLKAATC